MGSLLLTELNLIPTSIRNHTPIKIWEEIIYPFPKFNGQISHLHWWPFECLFRVWRHMFGLMICVLYTLCHVIVRLDCIHYGISDKSIQINWGMKNQHRIWECQLNLFLCHSIDFSVAHTGSHVEDIDYESTSSWGFQFSMVMGSQQQTELSLLRVSWQWYHWI